MKRFGGYLVWVICCLGASSSTVFGGEPLPRTIVALYQSSETPDVRDTPAHQFAEMPLNHLGYRLEYHDLMDALPDLSHRSDVAGVLSWLTRGAQIKNVESYLRWAGQVVDSGKRFIIMGGPGFYPDYPYDSNVSLTGINAFWRKLGLYDEGNLISTNFPKNIKVSLPRLINFEMSYNGVLPAFRNMRVVKKDVEVMLATRLGGEEESVLIAIGPNMAYTAEDYDMQWDETSRHWYINPFIFFRLAMGDKDFPRPDTTTLAGQRIYYGHIDGDGWISRSLISEYKKDNLLCADVILKTVLEPASDLPCSVGPIAADMDDRWVGFAESRDVARKIFALPHIEVAVHTYSHPFEWGFFKDYSAAKELPFLAYYPFGSWQSNSLWNTIRRNWMNIFAKGSSGFVSYPNDQLAEGYDVPRAYANFPFDLDTEVQGSIKRIAELAPDGKKPMVYLWSGDCAPFSAAIKSTREYGIRNLNGGNSRFDTEYPSYAWIRAIGRQAGGQQQIYASAANENVYTDNWRDRFYGYNVLPQTFRNTDLPWRIKPINLYYHMFSGEKLPSLQAVLNNIRYIRTQDTIPVTTSHFADIADGFYAVELTPLEDGRWAIEKRGALQTVRYDRSTLRSVDFAKSEGVLGQRHLHGSLYVFLQPNVEKPIVALKECLDCTQEPVEEITYLLSSRWPLDKVARGDNGAISFRTMGFGEGSMSWRVPQDGAYRVTMSQLRGPERSTVVQTSRKTLNMIVADQSTYSPITVTIERAL